MRAHTHIITSTSRSRSSAWHRALVLGLAVCSLAVPATASAYTVSGSSYSSESASDPSGYASPNAVIGASDSVSAPTADRSPEYSSVNAISGPPASEPTLVSGGSGDPADGFDWGSAAIGAGAVLAMGALGGAALLTLRRRPAAASSLSTS